MNRRESTRIAVARRRDAARVARSTDRRARPPRVAVAIRASSRARESRRRARGRAVWSTFTISTPSYTIYTTHHAYTIHHHEMDHARHRMRQLCVHTRMSEFSTAPASRRRRVGTRRRARRRDASDAVRSSAIRADSRRERARAAPPERRPSRDDRASIASRGRGADRAMDSRRRRRSSTTSRRRRVSPRTRFEDSTSRAHAARARGRRDARARRRATEEGSRARGARGRARDDEGRRGEKK